MNRFRQAAIAAAAGCAYCLLTSAILILNPTTAYSVDVVLAINCCLLVPVVTVAIHRLVIIRSGVPTDTETRCRKCGYILRGISEPRCPECGERI